ncbi:hypothetical protein HCU01_42750 [Halomonas cupida]|uniref:TPR repeat n=1 Tax=Halomonas cupida TaxID=44933 RepID=A0A1M7N0A7_9GAMM|nr:tetratricopeptide repeat protein [Halomonas cupida]GEN26326.1 hypothetical protein HCU01_42750 [Halomonas cupida]SHM96925.1 hypothetical protein SAMN05660971_04420 [Halomonas cupida]
MNKFLFLFCLLFSCWASAEIAFPDQEKQNYYRDQDVEVSLGKAKSGDAEAQYLVGSAYLLGLESQDVEVDYEKAFCWLSRSANQGIAEAQYELGRMYRYGLGVDKNGKKWEEYTSQAGEQGLLSAYGDLMDVYREGDRDLGIDENGEKYFYWLERSAEAGHALSMVNMSISYRYGYNVEVDVDKSFEWLMQAVEQDDLMAQGLAGEYFERGLGTEKDLVMAYMMYDLGGTGRNPEKQAVAEKMTDEQIQEAVSRSRQWQEEHNNIRPSYYGLEHQEDGSYR